MSLAQGNNTPTRPRIEPGSPDPESDALTTRPVRPYGFGCRSVQNSGSRATVSSHSYKWEKLRHHVFSNVFDRILFLLAGNDDMHKSLDEFEIWQDSTTDYGVSYL